MSEREADDTPKPDRPPQPQSGTTPGRYYYDDATGYETYDPEADEEDADEEEEEL
jgi:hypothetical protein